MVSDGTGALALLVIVLLLAFCGMLISYKVVETRLAEFSGLECTKPIVVDGKAACQVYERKQGGKADGG